MGFLNTDRFLTRAAVLDKSTLRLEEPGTGKGWLFQAGTSLGDIARHAAVPTTAITEAAEPAAEDNGDTARTRKTGKAGARKAD